MSNTSIPPPERARCAECDDTIHGSEHLHRDPATRRSDEILWVCEPCLDYLNAELDAVLTPVASKPAPATASEHCLGMSRNGGPRL